LNPASAFVKAAMAIYDIVMFFINQGSQVVELVNAVIEAITAIASGAVGGAAKLVENALARSLPVVIGFLASLLGVSGLAKKVQNIVKKIRSRIDKAIDKVLKKAKSLFKGKKGKKKNKKDTSISSDDKKKHEAIANKIYEKLKTDEETSAVFNQYFKSKRKQANQLKKYYSRQLKKGIKLTVDLEKIKPKSNQKFGLNIRVLIKPNDTKRNYVIFHKEGELESPINNLIERALEMVSDKFYQGKNEENEEDEENDPLPRGIQRTIASIQSDYRRATTGNNNVIEVGGNQFFVDQARNNYVYPYDVAQAAGITKKNGKITTDKEVKGYEYSKFNLSVGHLLSLLRNIHENRSAPVNYTAMLIASLAAEPFRYSPSHITNLIMFNNYEDRNKPAFDVMAMTTGGTDPRSSKNIEKDPKKKGTVPKKVRERQISIVKNDRQLYQRLENYYDSNKAKIKNENHFIEKFRNIIQDYLNKIN
jgi:hypothetical protein